MTPSRPPGGPRSRHAELADLLRRVSAAMSGIGARISGRLGLHPTDMDAIKALHATIPGPMTVGELGARIGLSSAAVTSLVDRLERAGHVERLRDAADRRRVHVRPTDRSFAVAGEELQGFLDRLDDALDGFDDAELEAARRFLLAVLPALEAADGAGDVPTSDGGHGPNAGAT